MRKSFAASAIVLTACTTTPYAPPVLVKDSPPFKGVMQLLADAPDKRLDVVVVHGMCTHDENWALDTIETLARAAGNQAALASPPVVRNIDGIDIISATSSSPAGEIHFSAFVWSGLTLPAKKLLAYDNTGTATDCAQDSDCTPVRAKLNGILKDKLLNDCLSDALIYQGKYQASINQAFIKAMTAVLNEQSQKNADKSVPLAIISESLGSKVSFDALYLMATAPDTASDSKRVGEDAIKRMSYVYMAANQLPMLSLADGPVAAKLTSAPASSDALSRLLDAQTEKGLVPKTTIVAFTDPNDQLSWRIRPEDYTAKAYVANVLVSNDTTYLGYLENPYTAHTGYLSNKGVSQAIMCGIPASTRCK